MKTPGIKVKIYISICTILLNSYCFFIFANNWNSIYYPAAPRLELSYVLEKSCMTDKDYSLLLHQTGLGRVAVDQLHQQPDGRTKIMAFQKGYYAKTKILREKLNLFTSQENLLPADSPGSSTMQLAPLKPGDIILTKSTSTLFWRHGHCGMVLDPIKGITLESLEPGTLSMKQSLSKWLSYPTFKIMRLKNADESTLSELVKYAENKLTDIKYSILASKAAGNTTPASSNCSQLIWQAFRHSGYDLDSNKGLLVTPEDIAKSPLLETVQVRGFNPDEPW